MRYFIELRYMGTAYCGWQRQPNAPSVQQQIEDAIQMLTRQKIDIVGAGRTDTGVHASHYVAHFDYTCEKPLDTDFLCYKLNIVLPHDIAIKKIYEVTADKHARFDAKEREYTYVIETSKNPFSRPLAWLYTVPLDMAEMNKAAAYLLEYKDFTSFAKLGSDNKTNICDVRQAEWHKGESGELIFTIRADRFLRNMIRAIVGTLVDVGRGKINAEAFAQIIESKNLSKASSSAAAEGLFLSDIKY